MDLAGFCEWIGDHPDERRRSRVLTGVSVGGEATLLTALGAEFRRVRVGEFVSGDRFVIMPESLFRDLDGRFDEIHAAGEIPVLTGLDGYLGLLEPSRRRECFQWLLRYVNGVGKDAVVTILRATWPDLPSVFANPSLAENDWIRLGDAIPEPPCITLLPKRLAGRIPGAANAPTLGEWINLREKGSAPGHDAIATVVSNSCFFPGLDQEYVRQIPDGESFLAEYSGFSLPGAGPEAFEWILRNTKGTNVAEELRERFFPEGTNSVRSAVLGRLAKMSSPIEQGVFLRFSRRFVEDGSYFAKVFDRVKDRLEEFRDAYLVPAQGFIEDSSARSLAEERNRTIRAWGVEQQAVKAAQAAFLRESSALSDEALAPWTGLGLDCEEREWVRRYMEGHFGAARRSRWLSAYLAPIGTGCKAADVYLHDYRRRKAGNSIDPESCRLAATAVFPSASLVHRDDAAKQAAADLGTFLLAVDGLGAEWVPFLVSLANEHLLQVSAAGCVAGDLPTETEFNKAGMELAFGPDRYEKPTDFDKIHHMPGLKPEDGFCRQASVLESEILPKIENLLKTWSRVCVTSDHGSSRLASLAYEHGLSRTLKPGSEGVPAELEPADWRYAAKPVGLAVDDMSFVCPLKGDWASIRGYDRFVFSSPPTFERHGGATMEERLVPWIVFEKKFTGGYEKAEELSAENHATGQITEDAAFGDL